MRKRILALEELMTDEPAVDSTAAAPAADASADTPTEASTEDKPVETEPAATGKTKAEASAEAAGEGEAAPEGGVDDDLTAGEAEGEEVTGEDLDNSMADVVTASGDYDNADGEIEEASATADTLGKIGERMEATLPEGGMGEVAVESLSVAIKHMCSQVGYKPSRANVFPALEGFQNPRTRVQATKIALEDLKSKVAEIWAALVAMIKKVMLAAKHFYANATSAAKAIIFQAGKLRDHAKKVDQNPGTTVHQSKIAIGPRLIVQGHAVSGDAFVKALYKHVRLDVLGIDRIKFLEQAAKAMQASEENGSNKGKENQAVILHASDVLKKLQGLHAGSVPLIFGGTSVITEINDTHASVHLDTVDANDGGEVDPLDSHQVIAVCSEIIFHMSMMAKAYGSAGDEAVAAVTDILHKAQSSMADATSSYQAGNRIKQLIAVTVTASKTLASYDLHVCKDALAYAQKSLTKDAAAEAA